MFTYLKKIFIITIILSNVFVSSYAEDNVSHSKEENKEVITDSVVQTPEEIEKQKLDEERGLFYLKFSKYLSNIKISLSDEVILAIFDKGKLKGVDPYIIAAQMKKESTYNNNAYNAGCTGFLQISKYPVIGYNKKYGTNYTISDLYKEKVNLEIGIEYLSQKYEAYGNIHYALMAYNGGDGYLQKSLAAGYKNSSYSRYITSLSEEIKNINIDSK